MDEIRDSFSRLKKKVKRQLGGSKREPRGTGSRAQTDSVDSAGPPTQAESHVLAGGRHKQEGTPQPDEPESVPARGGEDGQEIDVGGKDVGQRPEAEVTVEGERGRDENDAGGKKVERAQLSSSTASIPHSGKPESMLKSLPWLPPLIVHANNVDTSTTPETAVVRSDKSAEPSTGADEKKPSWKDNAFAAAKLLLRGVNQSADAFGPLKSVTGGLCFILDNYEVWLSSVSTINDAYGVPAN